MKKLLFGLVFLMASYNSIGQEAKDCQFLHFSIDTFYRALVDHHTFIVRLKATNTGADDVAFLLNDKLDWFFSEGQLGGFAGIFVIPDYRVHRNELDLRPWMDIILPYSTKEKKGYYRNILKANRDIERKTIDKQKYVVLRKGDSLSLYQIWIMPEYEITALQLMKKEHPLRIEYLLLKVPVYIHGLKDSYIERIEPITFNFD